ncbi:hypothetical protein KFE25_008191 [Diacronema lutheri]|uniref:DUF1279 domain-containing protein n=2 Tax=Diacronema lutheri TaxID=2081491 RepID=A0A8J5XNV4_DIALT|nr:hypothetical protein KFE25_008191 [Diacronema lutheri]
MAARAVVFAIVAVAAVGAEQLWVRKPRARSAMLVDAGALGALCEQHGLRLTEMEEVAAGKRRHCRGWCCGPIERFVAAPAGAEDEAVEGSDAQSIADLFGMETTVIGRDGVPRSAPTGRAERGEPDAAPSIVALEEADDDEERDADDAADDDDDGDDDDGEGAASKARVVARARARTAPSDDDDDDDDDDEAGSRAVAKARGAQPGGGGLVGLLLSGQAFPVLLSPAVTLLLAVTPKSVTTNLALARNVFYGYALLFFGVTALAQASIGALSDDVDADDAVLVRAPPSPAAAMQAALSGPGAPAPDGEETLMSRRAYDAAELSKLRSAVLSGAGLNLALSFIMKQRGASILYHRAIVGLVELVTHPLFRAHVLPSLGVPSGTALTRVTRPFPPPLGMMELMMKASGTGLPAGAAADGGGAGADGQEEASSALPAAA